MARLSTAAPSRQYITLDKSARLQPSSGINFPLVHQRDWPAIQRGEWLLVKFTNRHGLYLLQMQQNQLCLTTSVPQAVFL